MEEMLGFTHRRGEEYLIKDDNTDSGERCPICKESDALMDVAQEAKNA